MKISDLMTPQPQTVKPGDTLQFAARIMDDLNVGVLPVLEGDRLVGMLTDRDIVVRSTSAGQDPRTTAVQEAMTIEPLTLVSDASVDDALRIMADHQLRRMPVLDETGVLVVVVPPGDLSADGTPEAADALEAISSPAEPDR